MLVMTVLFFYAVRKNLMRKIAERMYVRTDTSFAFPVVSLMIVYVINARPIP